MPDSWLAPLLQVCPGAINAAFAPKLPVPPAKGENSRYSSVVGLRAVCALTRETASLNPPNRRMRTRGYGAVGGEEPRVFPYPYPDPDSFTAHESAEPYSPRNCLSLEKTKAINPARIKNGGAPKTKIPRFNIFDRASFCACAVR